MANRRETARRFAGAKAKAKTVAIGKYKVSDGGHDTYADGRAGWNADVGARHHPARTDTTKETEYVGPQSTSYNRSTRVGEKLGFDPTPYIVAASAGASLGGALKPSALSMFGRRGAKAAPIAMGLMAAGLVGIGHMAGERKRRRRERMLRKWMRAGVPSYRSKLR